MENRCSTIFNVSLSILAYCISSISWVFLTKFLVNGGERQLELPILTTWFQAGVTFFISYALSTFTKLFPSVLDFPEADINFNLFNEMIVPSITYTAMLTFISYCLINTQISFLFIATSLSVVFSYLISFFISKENISIQKMFCCVLVFFGFAIGLDQENAKVTFSTSGTLFAVAASFVAAIHSIFFTQNDLKNEKSFWKQQSCQNLFAFCILTPIVLWNGELNKVLQSSYNCECFWAFIVISGIFRFFWIYSGFYQTQLYSENVHNFTDIIRAAAQTIFAICLYKEVNNVLWYASNLILLVAFIWNHTIRQKDEEIILFHKLNNGEQEKALLAENGI